MKGNRISIRYKLLGNFAIFIICTVLFMWLFQIIFLDDFYKLTKVNEIESTADLIIRNIENEELDELLSTLAQNRQICMRIIDTKRGTTVDVDASIQDCLIHKGTVISSAKYYELALENNGTYLDIIDVKNVVPPNFIGRWEAPTDNQTMIYSKVVTTDNTELLLLLNTSISPVDATVNTLKIQLQVLSVLLVLLGSILAFLMYNSISRPIMKINEQAKKLALGNYTVDFQREGYKEVSELADTLSYASTELSKVEKLRQELIANISHDLRTPLTMIGGYAEAMRDLPGENTAENCQIIIDEVNRLNVLVSDVLDISKLQSGNQQLELEEYDLTESILNTLERFNKFVSRDGYTIDFKYQEHVYIKADELRISQVIYNLINNALTYTGEDKYILINQLVIGEYVRIEVIDHGIGISQENLMYIWDRYYKANDPHRRAVNGTGLGLSIVKNILELHNTYEENTARYGVESMEGEGSTFYFEYRILDMN
ncbi:MAG: HAMP domain-containing histidine kinase [Erysipelotrichaceae bacterium]|nr:HAMP domain-containing histidine kinase [Erysipelotrichaceae bacterium]